MILYGGIIPAAHPASQVRIPPRFSPSRNVVRDALKAMWRVVGRIGAT